MTDAAPPEPPAAPPVHRRAGRGVTLLVSTVLAIGLAVRLALAFHQPADEASLAGLPDQLEYLHTAQNFLDGRGFCFYDTGFADTVYAYRMPGYPLLIAACGANVRIVQIVQALIDVSAALAAYWLVRRLNSRVPRFGTPGRADDAEHGLAYQTVAPGYTGLVALVFVAFNPFLISFSTLLLSETLFTAMLIWSMFWLTSPRRWVVALGLVTIVLSIYIRPGAIALPVLLTIGAALVRPNLPARRGFWRVPAGAAAILLIFLLLLPWAIRNREQLGEWVWMTTNDGITLYDGFNPAADGSSNQAGFRSWPELKTMSEVSRSRYLASLAKQYAIEHPAAAIRLAGQKIARLWSPVPLSDEYGGRRMVVIVAAIFSIPLFLLAAAGVWFGRIGRSEKLFLLLPAVYFTIVHAATVGSLRYRVPVDVPMSVLAAVGAAGVMARRSQRSNSAWSVDND